MFVGIKFSKLRIFTFHVHKIQDCRRQVSMKQNSWVKTELKYILLLRNVINNVIEILSHDQLF